MIEIIIAIIFGLILGTITGVIPGLHVNTVGIIIFTASTTLMEYCGELTICSFLVSIALTHAMIEFLPSLLVGIPNEDTVLSIQPAHRLLFEGRAREALRLISFGGYSSLILLVLLIPVLFLVLPVVYNLLNDYIAYMLIIVMALMLYTGSSTNKRRLLSLLIFLISGILGIVMLSGNVNSNLSLLCMLSGLFSISNLIYNINNNASIPVQKEFDGLNLNKNFRKSVFAGSISGCILGLLPGLGPAQGTLIAQTLTFTKDIESEDYLVTNSGINVSDTLFSLIAIYLIGNPRSAISVYISLLMENITIYHVLFFIFISIISVSVACIISIKVGDYLIDNIQKIDYRKLCEGVIIFISLLLIVYTIITNGCIWYILICYVTSIGIGILVNVCDISKSNMMGVLILPSILTYLGVF